MYKIILKDHNKTIRFHGEMHNPRNLEEVVYVIPADRQDGNAHTLMLKELRSDWTYEVVLIKSHLPTWF